MKKVDLPADYGAAWSLPVPAPEPRINSLALVNGLGHGLYGTLKILLE